jgi:hypothetical protein
MTCDSSSGIGLVTEPEIASLTPPKSKTADFHKAGESQPEIPGVDSLTSCRTVSTAASAHGDDASQSSSDGGGDVIAAPVNAADDDQDFSTLDYSGAFHVLDFHHPYRIMWTVILGIGGLLDILATACPILRTSGWMDSGDGTTMLPLGGTIVSFRRDVRTPFLLWLEKHNVGISFLFSLLWFRLAFSKANMMRGADIVLEDRIRLVANESAGTRDGAPTRSANAVNPQTTFYRQILTEMVLLPVGLYILLYHFGKGIVFEGKPLLEAILELPDQVNETITLKIKDQEDRVQYEVFTERSKMSLLSAILHHVYRSILAATIFARSELVDYLKRCAKPHLVRRFLRNPLKFKRDLQRALQYLRWIKFMAPL